MDAKRLLFCPLDAALITGLAWEVARAGPDVEYSLEAEPDSRDRRGFLPKPHDWRPEVEWADVYGCDDIGARWIDGDRLRPGGFLGA